MTWIAVFWANFIAYKHAGKIIIGVSLAILILILLFFFWIFGAFSKNEKPIDNQQLNEWIEKEREKSAENFNAQEARTESVVKETQTIDRESKANLNKATQSDYSNVTNDELKKRIQEKARQND